MRSKHGARGDCLERPRQLATMALLLLGIGCGPTADGVRMYFAREKAPSLTAESLQALEHLGPTLVDRGVNFAVYSENATRLELLLFEEPESNLPTRTYPMHRFGDVWNVFVEGVGPGQHYGYRAWGPNWDYDGSWIPGSIAGFDADVDGEGNRFNPNKLLFDPYSKALHRDHDWARGNLASGPKRNEVTYAAAAKSVVVQSAYRWSETEATWRANRENPAFQGHGWNDVILYKVHLKGFTASPASGVLHPGTYRGMGQKADYLKNLGVTAVEVLPIHEKPLDGTYWGYQTLNFFAPELSYASTRRWNEVLDEFKWMVDELHQRGIEVFVDVVYNHTGEGGFWRNKIEQSPSPAFDSQVVNLDAKEITGLYSYRGLDNQAYYALDPSRQNYWNDTGVGNQTRANHRPFRRLILDSLRFYVEELHVDGFRFDLAPILGTSDVFDGQRYPWAPTNSVLEDIANDPALLTYNTRLIAEPWSAAGFFLSAFPASKNLPGVGWGEWNGHFRDLWRSLINQRVYNQDRSFNLNGQQFDNGWQNDVPSLGEAMTGSAQKFGWNGRRPYHSVNFITVHDGFTLYDLFSYDLKRNQCSPLNPICCSDPYSPFCDPTSGEDNNRSRDWKDEAKKRQMMRVAFAALLMSHGTPMLFGGDEWMRTQLGNNNAYSTAADNEWNWFDWGAWQASDERHRMHDFVRKLIQLRKDHGYALAPLEYGKGAPFAWKTPQNSEPPNWQGKSILVHYYDRGRGPELAILINMEDTDVPFALPGGRAWKRLVDTQSWFDSGYLDQNRGLDRRASHNISLEAPVAVPTASYAVPAKNIVILEAR